MTDSEDFESWFERERPDDVDPVGTWQWMIHLAEIQGRTNEAERLRRSGPPPAPGIDPRSFAPMVFATEVGRDPGGAIAVALAALREPSLRLVIAIGDGEGARFTRHLLDLLGRLDVAVASGSGPSAGGTLSIAGVIPPEVPPQSTDVLGSVRRVTASTPYLVLWANHGSLTDLAAVLADAPSLADRLVATVAVGPLEEGGTTPGQPHFGSDPVAAASVLRTLRRPSQNACDPRAAVRRMRPPSLITAEPEPLAIGAGSRLHRLFTALDAPAWAALLAAHLDRWFAQGHQISSQYAPLTIAEAMRVVFIDDEPEHVTLDDAGGVRVDPAGSEMMITYSVENAAFLEWLERQLRPVNSNPMEQTQGK